MTWTSNLECCALGQGTHVVRDNLAPGTHRISLATPDGQGGEAAASDWIKVVEKLPEDRCPAA